MLDTTNVERRKKRRDVKTGGFHRFFLSFFFFFKEGRKEEKKSETFRVPRVKNSREEESFSRFVRAIDHSKRLLTKAIASAPFKTLLFYTECTWRREEDHGEKSRSRIIEYSYLGR